MFGRGTCWWGRRRDLGLVHHERRPKKGRTLRARMILRSLDGEACEALRCHQATCGRSWPMPVMTYHPFSGGGLSTHVVEQALKRGRLPCHTMPMLALYGGPRRQVAPTVYEFSWIVDSSSVEKWNKWCSQGTVRPWAILDPSFAQAWILLHRQARFARCFLLSQMIFNGYLHMCSWVNQPRKIRYVLRPTAMTRPQVESDKKLSVANGSSAFEKKRTSD